MMSSGSLSEVQSAERYVRALAYMFEQHAGVYRDDGVTPYSTHPARVAEYLRRIAAESDDNVLCAALLHDTIEDCGITYDDIASRFGDDVATLVAELTNDNRLPKNRRKAAMLDKIPSISARAKRVKLADRLDNVMDLLRGMGSPDKRRRYESETERILQGCAGACVPLEEALQQALSELRALNQRELEPS